MVERDNNGERTYSETNGAVVTPEMEFYAEHDEETDYWCVFDTEVGKAWATCCDQKSAEEKAKEMNECQKNKVR